MSFAFPNRMEISCVRAGAWRIEGFEVERAKVHGKIGWQVYQRYTGHPDKLIGSAATLAEACDLIEEEQYRRLQHPRGDDEP